MKKLHLLKLHLSPKTAITLIKPKDNVIVSEINKKVHIEDHFYINDNGEKKYFDAYKCKVQIVHNPDATQAEDPGGATYISAEEWTEKGVTDYTLLQGYIDASALEVYGDGLNELLSILGISEIPLIALKSS